MDLASRDYMQGVDYILGADTHERIREPIEGAYAKVTEPGAFGSFVGWLDLVVEKGQIKEAAYDLMEVAEAEYDEDRGMRTIVDRVQAPYKKELSEVLGTTSTPLMRYYVMETPMDNLITDALFEATAAELAQSGRSVDVALSNGFRFCPPLVPKDGEPAEITREYLWSMLPVNAGARIATVPGSLLKDWMEKELNNVFAEDPLERFGGWVVRMKGMEVDFTAGAGKGRRVNSITIGGEEVDATRDYTFVACERAGDPVDVLCRIKGVRDREDLSFTLHDAVERYLANTRRWLPSRKGGSPRPTWSRPCSGSCRGRTTSSADRPGAGGVRGSPPVAGRGRAPPSRDTAGLFSAEVDHLPLYPLGPAVMPRTGQAPASLPSRECTFVTVLPFCPQISVRGLVE